MGFRQVEARYAFQDIKKGDQFEYDPLVHDAVGRLVDEGFLAHTGYDRDGDEAIQEPVYVEQDTYESDPLQLDAPVANKTRTKTAAAPKE